MDGHGHAAAADAHDAIQHATHDHHNDPEHIRKEVRVYLTVFIALGVLTAATVGASYLDLNPVATIALALAIASVKGFLVCAFFMHLLSERKVIYGVLILTVFFFGVLMWGPWHHVYEAIGHHHNNPPNQPKPHQPVTGH